MKINTPKYVYDNEELMKEWDWEKNNAEGLFPEQITSGSQKYANWICRNEGHKWRAFVSNRVKGRCCPYCSNKKVLAGYNDLETKNPNVAKDWHPTKNGDVLPSMVLPYSNKKYWWICSVGHEYEMSVASRSTGGNCPYCSSERLLSGFNDLQTCNPVLAQEWDYKNNGEITPDKVMPYSNKKYWWLCHKGHSYEATAANRQNGTSCPYCSNSKVLAGFNDLATTNPKLAAEWNFEKNSILPSECFEKAKNKVWWKCKLGHDWEAALYSRAAGRGCPVCAKELQTSFPEQAIAYYLSTETEVISQKKIAGHEIDIYLPILKTGIEYDGSYYHRGKTDKAKQKDQFFSDRGIKIIHVMDSDKNSVDGNYIEYEESKTAKYSNFSWAVNEISKMLNLPEINVDIDRDTILITEQYMKNVREHSIAIMYPDIAKEWDKEKNKTISPDMVSYGSQKKFWWRCRLGHSYQASPNNRSNGSGCPYCSGHKVLKGFNDIETLFPGLVKDWNYEKNGDNLPSSFSKGSHFKAWWMCQNNHEYQAEIASRVNGSGCPICAGRKR